MLITAQRLFDGVSDMLLHDAAVRTRGDRVQWSGPAAAAAAEPGEARVDLGDVTLMPGLIDMHNHLRIIHGEGDLRRQMADPAVPYTLRAARHLERNLLSGVTTMKSNGDRDFYDVEMREALRAGLARGPRLLVAGKAIKSTRCTGGVVGTALCDGPERIRAAIRDNVEAGVDFIKIFATGTLLGPREGVLAPAYSAEEIRVAADAAHAAGRLIAAHCHGGPAADACVEAGVDILEHGSLLRRDQLQAMAERGTWLCITQGVLLHPRGDMAERLKGPDAEQIRRRIDEVQAAMGEALRAGVRYVLGTDAVHGGLPFEVQAIARLGARPVDALRAGTSRAAAALRRPEDLGAIRPGAYADLIAVPGNPFESLACLDRVSWIMQAGAVLSPPTSPDYSRKGCE
jgi:imidazolonepropionase-like amidohydrolase